MEYRGYEVAKKLGITVPTLHYYEKAGLLPPIKRNRIGNRIYTSRDIEWIRMVVLMRKIDIPIAQIKDYVALLQGGSETVFNRYQLIKDYRISVEEKIKNMEASLHWLNEKEAFYEELMSAQNNNYKF